MIGNLIFTSRNDYITRGVNDSMGKFTIDKNINRTSFGRPSKLTRNLSSEIALSIHMSPLSGAGKHPDFQVTSCLQNVTTNVDFAYIESE
jgi:hypothetical protein